MKRKAENITGKIGKMVGLELFIFLIFNINNLFGLI